MVTAQVDCILTKFLKALSKDVLAALESMLSSNNAKLWFTIYVATFILLHEVSFNSLERWRTARDKDDQRPFTLPDFVQELHDGANVVLAYWQYYKTSIDPSDRIQFMARQKAKLKHGEKMKGRDTDDTIKVKDDRDQAAANFDKLVNTILNGWDEMSIHGMCPHGIASPFTNAPQSGECSHFSRPCADLMMDTVKAYHAEESAYSATKFGKERAYGHPLYFVSYMYRKQWAPREMWTNA